MTKGRVYTRTVRHRRMQTEEGGDLAELLVWIVGSLIVSWVILNTTGFMWCQMKLPPLKYVHTTGPAENRVTKTEVFHHNARKQTIYEWIVVMALYAAVSLGFLILNEAGSSYQTAAWKRTCGAFLGLTILCMAFSYLLSVLKIKRQGYPFSFLMN